MAKIARYQYLSLIGKGGMAQVIKAQDRKIKRVVAIKVLHAHHADDQEYRQRFITESQASGRLNSEYIVRIYDVGEDFFSDVALNERDIKESALVGPGFSPLQQQIELPYLVMEYVPGEGVDQLLLDPARKPNVADSLRYGIQVLRGLQFAHEQGVIHRDVKPANIMVTQDKRAKLADFGIARFLSDADLSQTQGAIGTAHYMSPEQINGDKNIGPATDIYSLGCTLFTILAGGETPYQMSSTAHIIRHLNHPIPDVCEYNFRVPVAVSQIIQRAMAKRPQDRWPSAEAMGQALSAQLALFGGSAGMGETGSSSAAAGGYPVLGNGSRWAAGAGASAGARQTAGQNTVGQLASAQPGASSRPGRGAAASQSAVSGAALSNSGAALASGTTRFAPENWAKSRPQSGQPSLAPRASAAAPGFSQPHPAVANSASLSGIRPGLNFGGGASVMPVTMVHSLPPAPKPKSNWPIVLGTVCVLATLLALGIIGYLLWSSNSDPQGSGGGLVIQQEQGSQKLQVGDCAVEVVDADSGNKKLQKRDCAQEHKWEVRKIAKINQPAYDATSPEGHRENLELCQANVQDQDSSAKPSYFEISNSDPDTDNIRSKTIYCIVGKKDGSSYTGNKFQKLYES